MKSSISGLITLGLLGMPVALVGATATSAQAIPTCHGQVLGYTAKKAGQTRVRTVKTTAFYNNTKRTQTETVRVVRTTRQRTITDWYVKGGAEIGYGPAKASVEAKYGKNSLKDKTVKKGTTRTIRVSAKHTGWYEYNWWTQKYKVTQKFYSYNPKKRRCVVKRRQFVDFKAPYYLPELREKRGRVNPDNY